MIDKDGAKVVEIIIDNNNKVWINVNGVCMLRIQEAENVFMDIRGVKMTLISSKRD